jgi:non-ribosomal peptide synthetase component F
VEQHAATRPAATAVIDGARTLTYRELNFRANACARKLVARGFRRGAHAVVRMERGADLAVALLAVLKAGGSYTWIDPKHDSSEYPLGISIAACGPSSPHAYVTIDHCAVLANEAQPSPNLPVLSRPSDIACVLHGHGGVPEVLVPHATIVAMLGRSAPVSTTWNGEPGALDLWLVLMSGAVMATAVEETTAVAA